MISQRISGKTIFATRLCKSWCPLCLLVVSFVILLILQSRVHKGHEGKYKEHKAGKTEVKGAKT